MGQLPQPVEAPEGGYKPGPLKDDSAPFSKWLVKQRNRQDRVGGFANAAYVDPTWPGGDDAAKLRLHLQQHGVRQFVLTSLSLALGEFQKVQAADKKKARTRAANKTAKASRKANRPKK